MKWEYVKEGLVKGAIVFLLVFLGGITYCLISGGALIHQYNPFSYFLSYYTFTSCLIGLFFAIPLSISIMYSKKSLDTEDSKKILYKMPYYSFISVVIIYFCMVYFILMSLFGLSVGELLLE